MNSHSRRQAGPEARVLRVPRRFAVSATAAVSALLVGLAASPPAAAQTASTPRPVIEELRQQEREKALRDSQDSSVDVRLPSAARSEDRLLPENETPCFRINEVVLSGEMSESFQWALDALDGPDGNDSPVGRCIGTAGVNIVLDRLQQALIAKGYITTRVLTAPQDLNRGTLTLTLVPGRIAAIRLTPDSISRVSLWNAIPARPEDLLNLRDIEQGLENLKRVPTAEADIQIEPSTAADARPGDSDLVVKYTQSRFLRGSLSLDDSGTKATGVYQAGGTLSVDNLFSFNDLFYVNATHSIDGQGFGNDGRGTEGQAMGYVLPYGNWLLNASASHNRYLQTVPGLEGNDNQYSGDSNNAELRLSRIVHRDQHRKTTLSGGAFRRESRSTINDMELPVQHQVISGWLAAANHKEFFAMPAALGGQAATLEANLQYRRGTNAFGAIEAPGQAHGDATNLLKVTSADVSLNLPIKWGAQNFRYSGLWRAQDTSTPLLAQDQFAIGGRYTVRGFDGEASLLGYRGWLVRNDFGWALPVAMESLLSGAEAYVGIDYGHIGGPTVVYQPGDHLAGGVVGLRGSWKSLSYDLFVGAPISKPEGFRTANVTGGFRLTMNF